MSSCEHLILQVIKEYVTTQTGLSIDLILIISQQRVSILTSVHILSMPLEKCPGTPLSLMNGMMKVISGLLVKYFILSSLYLFDIFIVLSIDSIIMTDSCHIQQYWTVFMV